MSTTNHQAPETLAAFEAIRQRIVQEDQRTPGWMQPAMDIYAMEAVRFSIDARRVTQDEAESALAAFDAQQGWICRQSSLDVFQTTHKRPNPNTGGVLLSAELVASDDRHSLHLRQDGHGGWIISDIREADLAGPDALDGLMHTTCQIGTNPVEGWLLYRVYWTHSEPIGWHPQISRFLRIDPDEKHSNKPCRPARS
ncbi:MAG: hypothetical protein ACPG4N_01295 [Gammaproteobacteria bacterium]